MTRYFSLCGALLASTMLAPMPAFAQQDAADADTVTDVVVIRGTHIPEPQRRTSQVATFIQNEDLQRQGDGDAAIALTRLSGLSIVSGRFAYVRGLGERYSLALLNGSPLPSPEPRCAARFPSTCSPQTSSTGSRCRKPSLRISRVNSAAVSFS